jgi:hypothetical protein
VACTCPALSTNLPCLALPKTRIISTVMKSSCMYGRQRACSGGHTFQQPQPYQTAVQLHSLCQSAIRSQLRPSQQHDRAINVVCSSDRTHAAPVSTSKPRAGPGSKHQYPGSTQDLQQHAQQQLERLPAQLTSVCAAAVITLSSCLGPAGLLTPAADARPRMTAEEQVSIEVFKKSTPSVVNVTNLTAR